MGEEISRGYWESEAFRELATNGGIAIFLQLVGSR